MRPAPDKLPATGLANIAFRHPKLSFNTKPTGKHLLPKQLHCKQGWTHSKPFYFLLIFVCTLITGIFRALSAMDLCKGCLGSFFFGFPHTECLRLGHPFWCTMSPKYTFPYIQARCSLVACKGLVFLSFHSPANFWMADLTGNQMERNKSQGDRDLLSTYVIELTMNIVGHRYWYILSMYSWFLYKFPWGFFTSFPNLCCFFVFPLISVVLNLCKSFCKLLGAGFFYSWVSENHQPTMVLNRANEISTVRKRLVALSATPWGWDSSSLQGPCMQKVWAREWGWTTLNPGSD